MKAFIGWVLATASAVLALLWFFGVITFVPPDLLGVVLGGIARGLGWIFGTALPSLGDIILDRLRSAATDGSTPPTTTVP